MKKGFSIGIVLGVMMLALSCNSGQTYSGMLKAQKKAINRLIDENDFEILNEYPANGVFKENQFVKLDNGIYLNVVDSGNGNRAVAGATSVLCRITTKWLITWQTMDTTTVNNFKNGSSPIVYRYGTTAPTSTDDFSTTFFSYALFNGLEYVGDSSVVKLIIPFEVQNQTSSFYTSGIPLYFSKVQYRFELR